MLRDDSLSPHFRLSEFTRSQTAVRLGIRNVPAGTQLDNLRRLAGMLEDVRMALCGVPIIVSSGYRCLALNRAIGSHDHSLHIDGRAADFSAPAFGDARSVCRRLLDAGLVFDELIDETDWVHLGIAKFGTPPRGKTLRAVFADGTPTRYLPDSFAGA